jgi:2-polyprenyl-3-methyl-5-hydroxy-6-metoxy-1,4-benzoquinol methylase
MALVSAAVTRRKRERDDLADLAANTDATHGQVSRSAAEMYEEFFSPALFAQWRIASLGAASLHEGDHILDVACGTGVLARSAAARVGARRVVGLDANEGMLAVARRQILIGAREKPKRSRLRKRASTRSSASSD